MPLRIIDHTGKYRVIAQFQWEWRDIWIGCFWRVTEPKKEWSIYHFYICIVPCIPLHITVGRWQ